MAHEHNCSVGKVNTNWFTNIEEKKKEISNCSERKVWCNEWGILHSTKNYFACFKMH